MGGGDISGGQPPTGVLTTRMLPHSLSAGVHNAWPSYGDKQRNSLILSFINRPKERLFRKSWPFSPTPQRAITVKAKILAQERLPLPISIFNGGDTAGGRGKA